MRWVELVLLAPAAVFIAVAWGGVLAGASIETAWVRGIIGAAGVGAIGLTVLWLLRPDQRRADR
jgi:hypothetical protein